MLFLTIFFTIPVDFQNARLKFALAIPTGTPITVANDAIEILLLVIDKKKLRFIKIIKKKHYIY